MIDDRQELLELIKVVVFGRWVRLLSSTETLVWIFIRSLYQGSGIFGSVRTK